MSHQGRRAAEVAGRRAETLVAWWMRLRGYRLLEQRYKTRSGEIDLIMRRGKTIVFIEVKQRARVEDALDPVSGWSEERIVRAGEIFLSRHPHYIERGFALRYDIAVVTGRWRIELRQDAFRGW